MERRSSARPLSCLLLVTLFLLLFFSNSVFAKAEENKGYPDIQVNRVVQIEDGGVLVINDTVTLSADKSQNIGALDGFQIGFPIVYNNNLAYFLACDDLGSLDAGLGTSLNGAGFCWVNVSIPERVDGSYGGSYDFSVVYVFSGLVKTNQTRSRADFPLYPSLAKKASFCNVTVMLPVGATLNSTSPVLSNRTIDSRSVLNVEKSFLEAFADVSSWAEFEAYSFPLFEVDDWRRDVRIDGWGELIVTDLCRITNKADNSLSKVSFVLPSNATDVSVQDVYGTYERYKVTIRKKTEHVELEANLRESLKTDEKVRLLIIYRLPFREYVAQRSWQDYMLNVSLVRPDNWVVKRFRVTVSLPEGAESQPSPKTPYNLEKEGFLIKAKFAENNVTRFHELNTNLEYQYLILWVSFRPTLWVGTVAAIVGGVFFIRKASRPAAVVVTLLSPKVLRKFVDTCEERRRVKSRLTSLEEQVRRGKISRRRYRLRRSSLDDRLSMLAKELAGLRSEIEAAGGRYVERMKQLETAEAEIETLERDIERVEVRFRRREISAEVRRRLLNQYNRIKEEAENAIDEILLRLREEIR